jgi:acyl-coenzyme A synthetase/AMP-(fatty) acid ligase
MHSKLRDGDTIWHRMGDAGCMDDEGRLWYCGRTRHRVETSDGVLFSVPVEEVFNMHPRVRRTALVGVGRAQSETPLLVVEPAHPKVGAGRNGEDFGDTIAQLRQFGQEHELTRHLHEFRILSPLPTDVRHNAKINREALKAMAQRDVTAEQSSSA